MYFGDSYSLKAFGRDVLFGAIGGGAIGGATAYFKGNNIWYGDPVAKGSTAFSFNNTDRDIIKIIPGKYYIDNQNIGTGEWRNFEATTRKIQSVYSQHGSDFGVSQEYNKINGEVFQNTLKAHVLNKNTLQIEGFYRGNYGIHYYITPITVCGYLQTGLAT